MRIKLESNFMLLGSGDIDHIDFDSPEITLKRLLDEIALRAANSPRFLNREGTDLCIGWVVEIDGRPFDMCQGGVNTVLKDGARVVINIEMLGGG